MPTRERKRTEIAQRLWSAGLRPTRQRIVLATLLFGKQHRHVTAERLYDEAIGVGARLSLATVYNTLNQFTQAGLLRQGAVSAAHSYFDTNISEHQHFYIEADQRLIDIPGRHVSVSRLPITPTGTTVDRIDVVIRLKRS